jgi:predicted DNA-binding protein YlxM (UPF0122 family)
MLEKLNRVNLLFDIYGPLLTARQREALRFYYLDDLSLGEIAEEYGTSRQAVYDLIRRAVAALETLERKLGLCARFHYQQECMEEADRILKSCPGGDPALERLQGIVSDLLSKNEQ